MEITEEAKRSSILEDRFEQHRAYSQRAGNEAISQRKMRLRKLRRWIHDNRPRIYKAMYDDFRKNATEVDVIEVFHTLAEIKKALANLNVWTAPRKVDTPFVFLGTQSFVQCEARGVCLIIAPWNYPFCLCVGPLVSALAAGNAVVLKPSEMTPNVSSLIVAMVREVFEEQVVSVVEGGVEVTTRLLSMPFDHIHFTGSPATGKVVMRAAAENLTSVTLELGGKSPAIVVDSSIARDAAKRIAFVKFLNNGQTCLAPDYVLVHEAVAASFVQQLITETKNMFTDGGGTFAASPFYCRIVNDRHFDRLELLLRDAVVRGATIAFGGDVDRAERFLHPTIVTDVPPEARLLSEEIFGPVLPIVTFRELDEAIATVNRLPKALAVYVFASAKKAQRQVLRQTTSGGACINDCGLHFMHENLPFGGVNHSGIGKAHGHAGFLSFSNEKAVMRQRKGLTTSALFYPPYNRIKVWFVNWFFRIFY